MMLARSALQSLDQVVDLFESLGERTRAAKVLVSISFIFSLVVH